MPELKHLRGVRMQEYDEEEWLQDVAEQETTVPKPAITRADRLDRRVSRDRKARRASIARRPESDLARLPTPSGLSARSTSRRLWGSSAPRTHTPGELNGNELSIS